MTTNQLTTFDFNQNTVRVVQIDGEPWFVATDVCRVLDLSNPSVAVRPLDDDEWSKANLGLRGLGSAIIISESGLYKLVMRSDKPQARSFQNWVTRDVLPAIRKDGGYIKGEEKVATGEMSEDELVFKAMDVMKRKIERLQIENEVMAEELNSVTVDEYRSLRHEYWPHSVRTVVGKKASDYCRQNGIEIEKQPRTINRRGKTIHTAVNVYPREVLDKVAQPILDAVA